MVDVIIATTPSSGPYTILEDIRAFTSLMNAISLTNLCWYNITGIIIV